MSDCKREGESTADFVANCTLATALVGKMEFCQYFPPSLCLLPIFNSSVIAFHLVKGTLFPLLVFLLILFLALSSEVWECCWECHFVGPRYQRGPSKQGKVIARESSWVVGSKKCLTSSIGVFPDESSLPVVNFVLFGLPWRFKSALCNPALALCCFCTYFCFVCINHILCL